MSKNLGTFKTRINGHSLIVTIPKGTGLKPNQELQLIQDNDGKLIYSPTDENPWNSMEPHDFKHDMETLDLEITNAKSIGKENI
ncbi:AbrB/MazE/SpoVT family DNA-binding domain-containing protein [Companilactobacillus mishanensis]|uniref:AbrB/MazE/SpoVT family DNA-binding domain-containing protein n=1 Tax=Companilactobacillus mishanensis TaxID=2486008 RepID=A0ABW9P9R6_9LACO|nr:AbrB/MazE/SpoVT family DNA-binding domain-containing protein [Companilactobacillus mishanensis]MQS45867.1 AbrB/MazE/SpoVT family DNA-binding domain-containing protein [Companilactobacillus mishanensis]